MHRKRTVGKIMFQQSFSHFIGSICGRGQNQSDKFIPISVDIKEELQISLFFALTFVASNKQQLALTRSLKYDSEYDIILER